MGLTASQGQLSPCNAGLAAELLAGLSCTAGVRGWQGLGALLSSDFFCPPLLAVEIGCQTRSCGSFLPLTACAPSERQLALTALAGLQPHFEPFWWLGLMGLTASLGQLSPCNAGLAAELLASFAMHSRRSVAVGPWCSLVLRFLFITALCG